MPHKFAIVIPDGAADEPIEASAARRRSRRPGLPRWTPSLAKGCSAGRGTSPIGSCPASDVATLSLFGYDPEEVFTGRAPLEAAAAGVPLGPDDWAVRCNLMTIRDGRLSDFTAGHITSEEGPGPDQALQEKLGRPEIEFFPGVSYRNLMIYRGLGSPEPVRRRHPDHPAARPARPARERLPAPRDRLGTPPRADRRRDRGRPRPSRQPRSPGQRQGPANAVWLWGQGKAPRLCPSSRCSTG